MPVASTVGSRRGSHGRRPKQVRAGLARVGVAAIDRLGQRDPPVGDVEHHGRGGRHRELPVVLGHAGNPKHRQAHHHAVRDGGNARAGGVRAADLLERGDDSVGGVGDGLTLGADGQLGGVQVPLEGLGIVLGRLLLGQPFPDAVVEVDQIVERLDRTLPD